MKKYLVIGLVLVVTITLAGCEMPQPSQSEQEAQQVEAQQVEANQKKLADAVKIPDLSDSLERKNIAKRLEAFNEPNKLTYIYLINFGKVMSFYTVKGKITSGQKRLTANQQIISRDEGQYGQAVVQDAPELDGTYGSSAPYIYFWTTEGAYVQWSGDYMLSDQPLKLTTQPELVREIK